MLQHIIFEIQTFILQKKTKKKKQKERERERDTNIYYIACFLGSIQLIKKK